MIEKDKINEIINKIVANYFPEKIILFGSYAGGAPNDDSDIDLLVVKQTATLRHRRAIEVSKYLYRTMIPMDILVYTPEEYEQEQHLKYSFLSSALKNSIVLYERKD
ncbi:MAG: nucleotidyltransferase domain-containing protein [Bacteroidia bacterium]|nr:nucleotidyltransferase domain-containing protein [Bacteroidia bacterium]